MYLLTLKTSTLESFENNVLVLSTPQKKIKKADICVEVLRKFLYVLRPKIIAVKVLHAACNTYINSINCMAEKTQYRKKVSSIIYQIFITTGSFFNIEAFLLFVWMSIPYLIGYVVVSINH